MMGKDNLARVEIRNAVADDIEALVAIRLSFLAEEFHPLSGEDIAFYSTQLREYYETHLGKEVFAVLAYHEETVISSVFLVVDEWPGNPRIPNGRVGTILNVYTAPEWRRNGLATQLMETIIRLAKEKQVSRIRLKASASGKPLYEKVGFLEECGEYTNMVLEKL